jgi:hypothetical protein
MKKVQVLTAAFIALFLSGTSWAHHRGVTELSEGNVRKIYVNKPLVGTKGYVVGDWENGKVRAEMFNLPASNTGYEVFLFEIDIRGFMKKMFVDGVKDKGLVANPPPFNEVGGLIKQWYSLGDLKVDGSGRGTLEYKKGENLYKKGLNMIMVFEKVTPGQHKGPEDFSKLMVECNGPLAGMKGAMPRGITIFTKK